MLGSIEELTQLVDELRKDKEVMLRRIGQVEARLQSTLLENESILQENQHLKAELVVLKEGEIQTGFKDHHLDSATMKAVIDSGILLPDSSQLDSSKVKKVLSVKVT